MSRFRPLTWAVATLGLTLGAARPQDESPTSGQTSPAAKICPTCRHTFPAADRFCRVDGVPLADPAAPRENARVCPRCKRLYDSSARFCTADGAPLSLVSPVPQTQSARIRPTKRAASRPGFEPQQGDTKPTDSTELPIPAGMGASVELDSPRLVGSAYISVFRSVQLAPHDAKETLQAKADLLAEKFRLARRIAVAIRVRADDPSLRSLVEATESELARRLRSAPVRDVELVPLESLEASVGWKRVLLDVEVAQAAAGDGAARFELTVRECDQNQIGPSIVESDPIQDALDRLALQTIRRLSRLVDVHFDTGHRLAREGKKNLAVEEFLMYLFGTLEFDTPQANEANRFVAAALHFSVLDWLWGDPDAAVVGAEGPSRRLPLGFRPASRDSSGGDLPRTIICLRDGSEMVLVPGGTETMGDDTGPADERPAHSVTLAPFYIDKLEISVGQYERFLAAAGHRVPESDQESGVRSQESGRADQWDGRAARKEAVQLPVVNVSWHDARAYAQWTGKSLPSEAQWERAARGRFAADYPRSVDPMFERHVNAGKGSGVRGQRSEVGGQRSEVGGQGSEVRGQNSEIGEQVLPLLSVYSFPGGLNPFGCQNMLGNVAEWCRDWYDAAYYSSSTTEEPLGPSGGELRVIRGGSWQTPLDQLGPTRRAALQPTTCSATVGFRCVLNLPDRD